MTTFVKPASRSFRPAVDRLEGRSLLSTFGGGNIDTTIPRFPSTSPQLNFTSNSFHQINATIPSITKSITSGNRESALMTYVTHIPNGLSQLYPILEQDVTAFQAGGTPPTTADATNSVDTLYLDLLGRDPDTGGLNGWVQALQSGMTVQQVAAGIVTSTEFIQDNITAGASGNANQTQFVTALYNDVLGRDPDDGGLAYWVGQINTGALSVQQVATDFVYSNEAETSDASVLQAAALPNTVTTQYYFGTTPPNGVIPAGNFPGTGRTAQLQNLIQKDTLAYLANGIGKSFNVLKSGVNFGSDSLLTYNGRVS